MVNNANENPMLSFFDRAIGSLHGLPDVVSTKATTLRIVPPFGVGSHLYAVQTFRQRGILPGFMRKKGAKKVQS